MSPHHLVRLGVVFVGALTACKSGLGPAREAFRATFFCPNDRIQAVVRVDLRPRDFVCAGRQVSRPAPPHPWADYTDETNGTRHDWQEPWIGWGHIPCGPPAGFEDDRERRAMLLAPYEAEMSKLDQQNGAVYEVRGCGYQRFILCPSAYDCASVGEMAPHAQH
jgi:hypothetical protein